MNDRVIPKWFPSDADISGANATEVASALGLGGWDELHRWTVANRADFWSTVLRRLGISFVRPPNAMLGPDSSATQPDWLPGAQLNIVASCFQTDPSSTAVIHRVGGENQPVTYGRLRELVARFANALGAAGLKPAERVAIAMPMTLEAVVAYLGVVAAGGVVVSIADSFAEREIGVRLRLTGTTLVVTSDRIVRAGKTLPMYEKVAAAGAERVVVVGDSVPLRDQDVRWSELLDLDGELRPVARPPGARTNVLFSSGTTGEPKMIPWTHLTPIKAAMDAHFHHDVHPGDVLAWPTNIGWMMGPWLIYASLINRATMALYDDVPTQRGFAEFVRDSGVSMLGVVPSTVAAWRASGVVEGIDWGGIRRFSSTGEASHADDMAYLMDLAANKPVIEYIGGTEIGGGYLAGTMLHPAVPSMFTTPVLGLDVRILDESGRRVDEGELYLVPPSIGLSTELLNGDHQAEYFSGNPDIGEPLRRHGDRIERRDGYYRAHGRVDDAMNLGGIKVGAEEIERTASRVAGVSEVAAVAVETPGGGPSSLVVFVVLEGGHDGVDTSGIKEAMQEQIRSDLNPLFKIHDVVRIEALPRTASQKVMRRELRSRYRR